MRPGTRLREERDVLLHRVKMHKQGRGGHLVTGRLIALIEGFLHLDCYHRRQQRVSQL